MRKVILALGAASLLIASPALAGISKNSRVPAGFALVIGGETPRGIDVDGQNRGDVAVELLVERTDENGDAERRLVRALAPRERFIQYIRADEAIVLRNTSDDARATVYWHVSGYSDSANPRIVSR